VAPRLIDILLMLGGDCYDLVLRFKFLSHLLHAFCAFSHVRYERDRMDLYPFPGPMFAQVRGWTSADWNRPGLVQCSPRIFWTGVEPVQ
jgi:hypothetical protein